MIIVKLYGGLGNQMFQYAIGRYLSLKHSTQLKFDIYYQKTRTDFNPEDIEDLFRIYNLPVEIASNEDIRKICSLRNSFRIPFISHFILKTQNYFKEENIMFNPKILSVPDNSYLDGYWQTEKYIIDIRKQLIKDFTLTEELTGNNMTTAESINRTENSVSIHIRGRDYLNNQATNSTHFVCDFNYYNSCIEYITQRFDNPYYFIFTDDPDWVKDGFPIKYPHTIIQNNQWNKNSHIDMHLMSLCKHNIVANSSFSWWAAWLNQNEKKTVLSPAKWYRNDIYNKNDVVPQQWIKINN